jgi:hypothetical protein
LLLLLLVAELVVVHDPANRRFSVRGYLYQIKTLFKSSFLGFLGGYYSELGAVTADKPDFRITNVLIDYCSCFALNRRLPSSLVNNYTSSNLRAKKMKILSVSQKRMIIAHFSLSVHDKIYIFKNNQMPRPSFTSS